VGNLTFWLYIDGDHNLVIIFRASSPVRCPRGHRQHRLQAPERIRI
jgi:hypothetical protein